MIEHTHINNPQAKVIRIGKTIHGKYIETFGKIGLNLPSCVVHVVWVSTIYTFQDIIFTTLCMEAKEKIRTI